MTLNEQPPLGIDYGSLETSSTKLKEFQASDVIGLSHGGTGVSSIADLSALLELSSLGGGGGVTDHGALTGLTDNDHPQYALSSLVDDNYNDLLGVSSTVFNGSSTWAGGGVSDHGALTGLTDNDHPQYVLSATNTNLSSLVSDNQTNISNVSSTVFNSSAAWAVDTDTTDHGSFTGLGDDDHPHYVLSATNTNLSSLVSDNQTNLLGVSSTVFDGSAAWAVDTDTTDHGAFTGLADNDHPQYVLSATNTNLSSVVDALEVSKAPRQNGFVAGTESELSFDNGTRTFTITPAVTDFNYYSSGILYTKSSAENLVIPDVEGLTFIYYDGATLSYTDTFVLDLIQTKVLACVIYWDATNNEAVYVGDERHEAEMAAIDHIYNHLTYGTRYESGLALGNLDIDGDGNDNSSAQLSISNGVIWDEDIRNFITGGSPQTLSPSALIPVIHRDGADGNWRINDASAYPVLTTGTGRAAYNEWTGAVWQLTEVDDRDFVLIHLYATFDIYHPIMGVLGQNTYANRGDARAGAEVELNEISLGDLTVLTPEAAPLATLIIETRNSYSNPVKSRFRSTEDGGEYVNWLIGQTQGAVAISAPVNSVFSRTGVVVAASGDYTASDITNNSSVTGDNVKEALETNSAITSNVSSTVFDGSAAWAVDTDTTDHGAFTGLADNDHPQYVLSATNTNLSSLVSDNQTNLLGVSSTVFSSSAAWATDTDTTDHEELSNIGSITHDDIDTHIGDGTKHFTEGSIDHGSITGLADDDHTQYLLVAGTRACTGDLSVSGKLVTSKLVGYDEEYDNGTVSTATTIDWNNGNMQVVTISASLTLSFTDPASPIGAASLTLRVVQSGASNVTTLPTIKWPRGSSPTISSVNGTEDVMALRWNGTSYYGSFGAAYS